MPLSFVFSRTRSPRVLLAVYLLGVNIVGGVSPSLSVAADVASVKRTAATPQISESSDEPMESMSAIRLPPNWSIDLFAAEPDVANVVAFDVDHQGRLYVCETFRQNRGVTDNRAHDEKWLLADLAAETVQDRIDYHKRLLGDGANAFAQQEDRIRRIVDTDGDGSADESTVFADGFNSLEEGTGAGVLAHRGKVYYTCIPKLWQFTDPDGDGVADERTILSDGYGVRVAFRGHDLHGVTVGYDGRLYFSIGDRGFYVINKEGETLANPAEGAVFRCELDGTGLEVFAHGLRNPQELDFNDYGDWFTVDNNSDSGDKARIVHLLEHGDSGWRMHYQYLPDRGPFNRQKIWEPHHNERPAHLIPPVANFTDGPSGLAYYPGTGFGDELNDRFLICDFRGGPSNSGIRSFQLQNDGAFYQLAADAQPIWSVLATDIAFGPGGELFVSDWVNGWDGLGKARIYRITDPAAQQEPIVEEVKRLLASDVSQIEVAALTEHLRHADRRVRLMSQWELAIRGEADALVGVMKNLEIKPRFRLHGFWGAEHAARLQPTLRPAVVAAARELLDDPSEWIRAAACSLLGDQKDGDSVVKLIQKVNDENARVAYFATMALSELIQADTSASDSVTSQAFVSVVAMTARNANADPALRHAAIRFMTESVRESDLVDLRTHESVDVRRAAVAALRGKHSEQIAEYLSDSSALVATEAAMAIHDEPIPAAEDSLVELLSSKDLPLDSDPLLRRVLSAAYRIGTPSAAASVAGFAASDLSPKWARIEAIDLLGHWADPDPRCRVTNEFRPLPPRPAPAQGTTEPVAKAALSARIDELMLAGDEVREKVIDVASKLGISKITPNLIARFEKANARPEARASALTAIGRLSPAEAIALAKKVDGQQPVKVILASLDVLGRLDAKQSVERIVDATKSESQSVRGLAWDLLAENSSPLAVETISAGFKDYLSDTLPTDVRLNVAEAVRKRLPQSTIDDLLDYQAKKQTSEPLAKWYDSLHGGDAEAGKKVFFEKTELSCVRCHKVDRAGGEVGPNLTVIGKTRDRRTLLEAICLPDAKIAEGFETAVIADEDGQVYTGIVASENEEFVDLIAADGTRSSIDKELIIARKKGKSSMPAGLVDQMTPRQLRDLVAYLASLQVDPRATTEVE
ncbi:PVC-type heme-binding CxxCH protein [Neorhodopirellula pilleata]|uniref:Cytochrome c n=1 Tax=Neorhodopirellula pilleata TaxID=2714738 RepID=A0A5C6AR88_9BACT|nr:PVC-type heme-binding CxxCH protein [Neorhodopirellula pilleata]TWU02017.1 Cytochrome c [Neorhodopirellula pilleata]